jgi:hypothetical protein
MAFFLKNPKKPGVRKANLKWCRSNFTNRNIVDRRNPTRKLFSWAYIFNIYINEISKNITAKRYSMQMTKFCIADLTLSKKYSRSTSSIFIKFLTGAKIII